MTSTGLNSEPLLRVRDTLRRGLADNWWLFLLRGAIAIAFGLATFAWPGVTILALTLVWAAYAIGDGAIAVWAAITGKNTGPRWWLLIAGVVGLAAGVWAIAQPGLAALALLTFIGVWSLVVGIMQLIGAVRLRKEIDGEWLLMLTGVANILFGVVLLSRPASGAVALAWLLGIFAVLIGAAYVMFALKMRQHRA